MPENGYEQVYRIPVKDRLIFPLLGAIEGVKYPLWHYGRYAIVESVLETCFVIGFSQWCIL